MTDTWSLHGLTDWKTELGSGRVESGKDGREVQDRVQTSNEKIIPMYSVLIRQKET